MDTFRKWLNKPKADDKSLLARFYHADHALTSVASELDSFDGRAEPERCSRLVSRLRMGQEHLLAITQQIMDELLGEERTARTFRAKFPEEVLQESLAGQLWFGAECLAAGSSILNREAESTEMRPLAKAVTKSLDHVRNLLREQCLRNNTPNSPRLNLNVNDTATEQLCESLKIFDRLFAEFELRYVSAMVNVKSKYEHEMQEMICVLFSETLQRALKFGLIEQDQVDSFDPALMFSIPRLAIITGLIIFDTGPLNMGQSAEKLSEMFRPFRMLLIKIRDLLRTLSKNELHQLERLLCTNEEVHLRCNNLDCDDNEEGEESGDDPPFRHGSESWKEEAVIQECDGNNNRNRNESWREGNSENRQFLDEMDQYLSSLEETWGRIRDECQELEEAVNGVENGVEEAVEENQSIDVINDCASGYLVPNTNLGYLLQPSEAPLTDSFISTDDEPNVFSSNPSVVSEDDDDVTSTTSSSTTSTTTSPASSTTSSMDSIPSSISSTQSSIERIARELNKNILKDIQERDSGLNTETTSSDRTPDMENKPTVSEAAQKVPNENAEEEKEVEEEEEANFSQKYSNNWKNVQKEISKEEAVDQEKTEPSCSRTNPTSRKSKHHHHHHYHHHHSKNEEPNQRYSSLARKFSTEKKKYLRRCVACPHQNEQSYHKRKHHHKPNNVETEPNPKSDPNVPSEILNVIKATVRMKFKSKENLLHRLFVCIAGVADQLQTNFASDLRKILRSVFLINVSPPEPEIDESMTIKLGETKAAGDEAGNMDELLFEFRPTERDIIGNGGRCENENSPNAGSNQSINSAEEVNPEDNVFVGSDRESRSSSDDVIRTAQVEVLRNQNNVARSHSLGDTSSLSGSEPSEEIYKRTRTTSTSAVPRNNSYGEERSGNGNVGRTSNEVMNLRPPRWVPDEEAPRCMSCSALFTAFRRRHHCRHCGKVFCGICSNVSAPIPKFGFNKAVRVCRGCYSREMGAAA